MTTPLYPTFEKRIDDATLQIIRKQVDPWLFMPLSLSVKKFDGSPISYSGIKFNGGPRIVFWSGYIQPFLEDLIVSEIAASVSMARERKVDGHKLLLEVQGLLLSGISKVFTRMADVDRRMCGDGFPENVPLRNTTSDQNRMADFLDRHIQAEISMWRSKPALQRWYDENKATVWIIGSLLTVISIVTSIL